MDSRSKISDGIRKWLSHVYAKVPIAITRDSVPPPPGFILGELGQRLAGIQVVTDVLGGPEMVLNAALINRINLQVLAYKEFY